MANLTLVIGNYNYSSWSLRPWLAMKVLGIPFEERRIPLYGDKSKAEILKHSPAGKVPVLVDAGVGTASDAAIAMELGCDGVLMNTAIALAKDPVRMAGAMKLAVEAGREAFLAGRMPRKLYAASPSSPTAGLIG